VETQIGNDHGENEENSLSVAALQELQIYIGILWVRIGWKAPKVLLLAREEGLFVLNFPQADEVLTRFM